MNSLLYHNNNTNEQKVMTSYQKLKLKHEREKAELMADILALISDDPQKRIPVLIRWKTILKMEKAFWHGETNTQNNGTGFISINFGQGTRTDDPNR